MIDERLRRLAREVERAWFYNIPDCPRCGTELKDRGINLKEECDVKIECPCGWSPGDDEPYLEYSCPKCNVPAIFICNACKTETRVSDSGCSHSYIRASNFRCDPCGFTGASGDVIQCYNCLECAVETAFLCPKCQKYKPLKSGERCYHKRPTSRHAEMIDIKQCGCGAKDCVELFVQQDGLAPKWYCQRDSRIQWKDPPNPPNPSDSEPASSL